MEIINNPSKVVIKTPTESTEHKFSLPDPDSSDNSHILANALIQYLYSNPLYSAIREAIQNAVDAIRENNTFDKGIHINIPDNNNKLSITDYGKGISKQTFQDTYGKLGHSTKRSNNSLNGGFGIGRMSALAASEQVYVYTIHEGMKYTYFLCMRDTYSYMLLSEEPTTEHSGTTVELIVDENPQTLNKIKFYVTTLTAFLDCPVSCNDESISTVNGQAKSNFSLHHIPNSDISYKLKYAVRRIKDFASSKCSTSEYYSVAIQIGDIIYYNVHGYFKDHSSYIYLKDIRKLVEETNSDVIDEYNTVYNAKLNGLGFTGIKDYFEHNFVTDTPHQNQLTRFCEDVSGVERPNATNWIDNNRNFVVIKVPTNYLKLSTNRESWDSRETEKIRNLIIEVFKHIAVSQKAHLDDLYAKGLTKEFAYTLIKYRTHYVVGDTVISADNFEGSDANKLVISSKIKLHSKQSNSYFRKCIYLPSDVNVENLKIEDFEYLENSIQVKLGKHFFNFFYLLLRENIRNTETFYSASSMDFRNFLTIIPPEVLAGKRTDPYDHNQAILNQAMSVIKSVKEDKKNSRAIVYSGNKIPSDWGLICLPCTESDVPKSKTLKELYHRLIYLTHFDFFATSNVLIVRYKDEDNLGPLEHILSQIDLTFVEKLITKLPTDKPTVVLFLRDKFYPQFKEDISKVPLIRDHLKNSFIDAQSVGLTCAETEEEKEKKEQQKKSKAKPKLNSFLKAKAIRQLTHPKGVLGIPNIYSSTTIKEEVAAGRKYFVSIGYEGNLPYKSLLFDSYSLLAPFIPFKQFYLVTPNTCSYLQEQEDWIDVEELYKKVIRALFARYKSLFDSLNNTFSNNFFTQCYSSSTFTPFSEKSGAEVYIYEILHTAAKKIESRELNLLLELINPDYITTLRKAVQSEYEDVNLRELVELIDPDYMKMLNAAKINNSPPEYLSSLLTLNEQLIKEHNSTKRASMIEWLTNIVVTSWFTRNEVLPSSEGKPFTLTYNNPFSNTTGLSESTTYRYLHETAYEEHLCPLYRLLFSHYPLLRWVFPVLEASKMSLGRNYPITDVITYMEKENING
jgi:hypothetical protein